MNPTPGDRYPGPALRIAAAYAWRLILVGGALYVVFRLLDHLLTAVVPFVVALLISALLRPVVRFLIDRGVPRALATLLAMLLATVVLGGLITAVVLRAASEAPQLGDAINRVIPHIKTWLEHGPLHVSAKSVNGFSNTLTNAVSSHSSQIASTAISTGKAVGEFLTGLLLAFFTTIFLLFDGEGIWYFLCRGFPEAARPRVDRAGREAWSTLSHYVQGTLIVATYHGVVVAIALSILGVPLVLPLAVLVGLGSFIPLVGAIVFGVLAVAVAGVSQGLVAAIVMAAVLVVDNQIESHVLQPFVVGRYVRVHPLAVVLGLAVGGILLGIFGAIIAVPFIGCVNAAVRSLTGSVTSEPAMDPASTEEELAPPDDG
jgi:predicted PurR-regulated permease PerM